MKMCFFAEAQTVDKKSPVMVVDRLIVISSSRFIVWEHWQAHFIFQLLASRSPRALTTHISPLTSQSGHFSTTPCLAPPKTMPPLSHSLEVNKIKPYLFRNSNELSSFLSILPWPLHTNPPILGDVDEVNFMPFLKWYPIQTSYKILICCLTLSMLVQPIQ